MKHSTALFTRVATRMRRSLIGHLPAAQALGAQRRLILQELPLAEVAEHDADRLWSHLALGDAVVLKRERTHPVHRAAVAVKYQGRTLGYLPSGESSVVAAMLDRGERLAANIVALKQDLDPFKRLRVAVFAEWAH